MGKTIIAKQDKSAESFFPAIACADIFYPSCPAAPPNELFHNHLK